MLSSCKPHQVGDYWIRPQDRMVLVYVPSGEFQMGSSKQMVFSAAELCKSSIDGISAAICKVTSFMDEYPDHPVDLSAYWLDQTEVTNRQYQLCVEIGVCDPPKEFGSFTREIYFNDPRFDDYPVVQVTWPMAENYCNWVDARLPTEAEWEYASRGPDGFLFPWGNEFDPSKLNYCDVNCKGISDPSYNDGYPDTAPVGSFPEGASWVGALDLSGNVREWVADWYGYFPNERVSNPQGPLEGNSWASKGGSWYDAPFNLRSTNRGANDMEYWRHKLGFRCAMDDIK